MGAEVKKKSIECRVCVVSPLYHPALGGLGRQAQLLTERLSREGVDIFVIARRMEIPPAPFSPEVVVHRAWSLRPDVINFERPGLRNILISLTFSISCGILLFSRRKTYEIVHFHGASLPFFVNLPLLKLMGKKVIAKVAAAKVGTEAGSLKGRYCGLGSVLARLVRLADGFIATTGEIQEGLLHEGIHASRIRRIPNFIDIAPRSSDKNTQGKMMKVIFSGRFIGRKGIDHLLRAWKQVAETFPDALLTLLGDGPLFNDMKRMSSAFALDRSVKFTGHVSDVEDHLKRADIFVLPSLQEGMPNALLEAMACGLPAVATAIGGVVDIISDGENGIIVEPANADALAQGLLRLLGDKAMAVRLGKQARKTIEDRFSLDSVVVQYQKLYQDILAP